MPIKSRKSLYLEREKKRRKFLIWVGVVVLVLIFSVVAILFSTGTKQTNNQVSHEKDNDRQSANSSQATPLKNSEITIEKAVFESEYLNGRDVLKIVTVAKSIMGDEVLKKHEWKINGKDAGNGGDTITGFKRGDKISVRVTPYNEKLIGHPVTLSLQIENSTPEVSGGKELINDGKTFSYQISARDPDGDTLSYELVSAPEGMTIDQHMGTLNWIVNKEIVDQPITVKITDTYGAQVSYKLSAAVRKDSPARNPQ